MKTLNALIYHCQRCGRVVHQSSEADPPTCCQGPMSLAAAETVCGGDALYEGPQPETVAQRDDRAQVSQPQRMHAARGADAKSPHCS